jgi:hypothetical protein
MHVMMMMMQTGRDVSTHTWRPARKRTRTPSTRTRALDETATQQSVDVVEVSRVLSHVVHATSEEPSYALLKLGLSMSNVTDATTDAKKKKLPAEARAIAWIVERRENKQNVEDFWANVDPEAVRRLFPTLTEAEATARLLRSLYFKAERAPLSEATGGLATAILMTKLLECGKVIKHAPSGRTVTTVRVMKAPRPLTGELFANPEILYHGEKGPNAKRNLLAHELGQDIAEKLGTRAAFHCTAVAKLSGEDDETWIEIDIAGPAMDNYQYAADDAVPLCVDGISPQKMVGWTSSVDDAVAGASPSDLALARDWAQRAFALITV